MTFFESAQISPSTQFILRLINESCSHILTKNLLFFSCISFRLRANGSSGTNKS